MQQTITIRAFMERRQEIETTGSQEERDCLKGLDALIALAPEVLEIIGDVPLVSRDVVEIAPEEMLSEATPAGEGGNENDLPF